MSLMDEMRERAAADVQRVAFFEGENPTMIKAIAELTAEGLAVCTVVGNVEKIRANAEAQGVSLDASRRCRAASGRPRASAAVSSVRWSVPS